MTSEFTCPQCGTRSATGGNFCPACGGSVAVAPPGVAAAPAAPPTPAAQPQHTQFQFVPPQPAPPPYGQGQYAPQYGQPPYGQPPQYGQPAPTYNAAGPVPNAGTRPTGITILAVAEGVTAVITALVAIDLLRSAYVDVYNWDDFKWGLFDGGLGILYGAIALNAYSITRGLWFVQPWAWKKACIVSWTLLGIIVASALAQGVTPLDVFGVAGQLFILFYLSQDSVRALFGKSKATS